VLPVVSSVADWRAKTELAEDTGSVAHPESARATEDDGQRWFAAAKRGGTCGGEHLIQMAAELGAGVDPELPERVPQVPFDGL
jgi:hypothetical protein